MLVRARLEQNDKIVIDDIEIDLHEHDPIEGLKSWRGSFWATHEMGLEPGQQFRLVLEDGRAGDMFIERMVIRGGTLEVPVHFVGSGPLA